ncbi:MAG TPA: phosphoglycerol transferase, partial [Candidatus Dorea intestinavium]|nr:phosphoglycerol transferase [Candidatus Dorea intestinavium]
MFKKILAAILGTLFIFLSFALIWMNFLWPNLSMEELIYTISNPMTGVDKAFIYSFMKRVVFPTLFFLTTQVVFSYYFRDNKKRNKIIMTGSLLFSLLFFLGIFYYTYDKLNVYAYYKEKTENEGFIDEHYVDPKNVKISFPATKRNLIYIYLESMEVSDANEENGGAFAENYIPNLTALEKEGENFSGTANDTLNGAYAFSGGTWTMG